MTLQELSVEYRTQAAALRQRIGQLEAGARNCHDPKRRAELANRANCLTGLWRETRDVAVLLERYYERGYRRNGKYTL